jgi:uncharacterized protein YndB with AHSA1/START domain
MSRHRVTATATLKAPADAVYRVLADYREHHPRILPSVFSNFVVHERGVGAGTRIGFDLKVMGMTRHYEGVVSEPEPGRRLVESYPAEDSETWFLVEPAGEGCSVTIGTEFNGRGGVVGKVERWLSNRILHPIYVEELGRLDAYAQDLVRRSK